MISDDQLHALKDRNPVHSVAGAIVKLRRKGRGKFIGPCPICSEDHQSKTASRFECDAESWVCAVCADGGDVIKLVCKREGLTFPAAVERLGGAREEAVTPAMAERRGLQDYGRAGAADVDTIYPDSYGDADLRAAYAKGWRKAADRDAYAVKARERERARLFAFWQAGAHWIGTPVDRYLSARGVSLPANARLRYHASIPSFADGREDQSILAHRGPAMLAAILDPSGRFAGLHITWLDPAGPKGKAAIVHPDTGEALPSKKVRGSKAGNYIDLGGCAVGEAAAMIAGEGIETVGAVWTGIERRGRDVSRVALRSSIDLGNLAGKALHTLPHPTLKTDAGRPQRVPGCDPDLAAPAMPVPDALPLLILLGDGDSDPFLTRHALERARARHARADRRVSVTFAPAGLDFNDLIQGPATAGQDEIKP